MTQIQQDIRETIEEIVHLQRVEAQLSTTREQLEKVYDQEASTNKKLDKELRDVEKLEGFSTKSIFYKVLGSKEKQLEKERQEYLELTLKYEDLKNEIKLLEYEENLLDAKMGSVNSLEKKLAVLKSKREEEIIQTDPKLRNKLIKISQELEHNYRLKQELEEAMEVGGVAHNLLKKVIQQLSQVRNWGSWSGSSRSQMQRMQRRHAIDRARNLTFQIKHHLNLFDQELRDVGAQLEMNVDTSAFTNFTDYFFNNIITDWILNQQLTNAIGSAQAAREYIYDVLQAVQNRLDASKQAIVKYDKERNQILES